MCLIQYQANDKHITGGRLEFTPFTRAPQSDWLLCSTIMDHTLAGLRHLRDKIRKLDVNGDGERRCSSSNR
jgi:hypothetical protein